MHVHAHNLLILVGFLLETLLDTKHCSLFDLLLLHNAQPQGCGGQKKAGVLSCLVPVTGSLGFSVL